MFFNSQALLPELPAQHGQLHFTLKDIGFPAYHIQLTHLGQHTVMLSVALVLGFVLGTTYEIGKTRDLRYKLNRIDRELDYYQSKQ